MQRYEQKVFRPKTSNQWTESWFESELQKSIQRKEFHLCDFRGADLQRKNLTAIVVTNSDLRHVKFIQSNLTSAEFRYCDL
jgi:uncharacterized protein YjbI with pentapeptide repeats